MGLELVDISGVSKGEKRGLLLPNTTVMFSKAPDSTIKLSGAASSAPTAIIKPNFNFADLGIGGLDEEFSNIFRRAFVSRIFPPHIVEKMGIQHVKGLILYGIFSNDMRPTGNGKDTYGTPNR